MRERVQARNRECGCTSASCQKADQLYFDGSVRLYPFPKSFSHRLFLGLTGLIVGIPLRRRLHSSELAHQHKDAQSDDRSCTCYLHGFADLPTQAFSSGQYG